MPALKDEEAEYAVYAPPRSDSSRASSLSRLSSVPSEPDTPPPAKRRKLPPSSSQSADLTSLSPGKAIRLKEDVVSSQPSNIQATLFTSSNQSSYSNRGGASRLCLSQGLPSDGDHDLEETFPHLHSSQPKLKNTYGSQPTGNIHKAASSKRTATKAKREGGKAISLVPDGNTEFKAYDTKPLHAIRKHSILSEIVHTNIIQVQMSEKEKAFKAPAVMSPSPRSKRAAKRSRTPAKNEQKPTSDAKFIKPPRPPSPQRKKSTSPPVIVTKDIPLESGRHPAALESIKAKLNISVDLPPSSAALSSEPSFLSDGEDDNSSSLSSAREVEELEADQLHDEWTRDHPPASPKTQCQICKEFISRLFVEEFASSAVLSVRQQQRLCRAHRVRSAEATWKTKGYPSIDWVSFPQRLSKYDAALSSVLSGTSSSFYRNAFEEQIKAGNRTLRQTLMSGSDSEGLKRGYYGAKGARMMMDYLMSTFASRIRRRAATDRLVSAAGVAGFVQTVLAPELVVMLVKDDMRVDDEQARVILEESSEVGHLLNEEEDETIKDAAEDEMFRDVEGDAVGGAVEGAMAEILELD
ncbi:MAG: hypothetical protein LQ344_004673 [Seirophora lacunosa]|nr:MAG: hypothetical protein LQ344_004673 [Seirophora lacunosa]